MVQDQQFRAANFKNNLNDFDLEKFAEYSKEFNEEEE